MTQIRMIARIWKTHTTLANAGSYEFLLKKEVFPEIIDKNIDGFRNISLLTHELKDEVEFVTIMKFKDMEFVRAFAGEDYQKSYVPDKAKQILLKLDKQAKHYIILETKTNI